MILFRGIKELVTLEKAARKEGRRCQEEDLSVLAQGAILVSSRGQILWVGKENKFSSKILKNLAAKVQPRELKEVHLNTHTVLPGFIECHTHLGFAGHRSQEFEWRMAGASYQEIYEKGGGIQSTVQATRRVSLAELRRDVQKRARTFLQQGVTYLEVKSGYGLDLKNELKLLEAYKDISFPRTVKTYLGLHAKSPDHPRIEDYFNYVLEYVLPQIAKKKLADRVDVFVEKGFYTTEQALQYFDKARQLGLDAVIHADQLTLSGGSDLAVDFFCLSADHLVQITEREILRLAESEVTCVLLPAADLYLKCAYPPARELIDRGARVALATDFNPGSSPTQNLNLVGVLARLEMKMKLYEVLIAYTVGAAHALKVNSKAGSLTLGMDADFVCTQKSWRDLFYQVGEQDVHEVFGRGRRKWRKTN